MAAESAPVTLDELRRDFSRDLWFFIARRVARPEDADDIRQIVFLRMAKGLADPRDQDRLLAWMYTLTRNAITDYYRAASHRRELAVDVVPDLPADEEAVPEDAQRAVRELATAAKAAGVSLSGMKSRVQRGRARLQRMLLDCCEVSQDPRGRVQEFRSRDPECECGGNATSEAGT